MSTESESQNSLKNEVLEQFFFAGCQKNFVGTGSNKVSKDYIKELDIEYWTEKVDYQIRHTPLYLATTYFLGLCRIHQKSAVFLQEDVTKLYDQINSCLYNTQSTISTSKKAMRKSTNKSLAEEKELDAESILSSELCEDFNIISVFEQIPLHDNHLLDETNILSLSYFLPNFGDELHLQNSISEEIGAGPSRFTSIWSPEGNVEVNQIQQSRLEYAQSFSNQEETGLVGSETHSDVSRVIPSIVHQDVDTNTSEFHRSSSIRLPLILDKEKEKYADNRSPKTTPKRKSRNPLEETPTKRQRKSPLHVDASDARSSASRRLFNGDEQTSTTTSKETMLTVVHPDEMRPFSEEHLPVRESTVEVLQSSNLIDSHVENLEQDREFEQPATDTTIENFQSGKDSVEEFDKMQLQELDDESLSSSTSKRRKRRRQLIVFDEETRISLNLDQTDISSFTQLYTKNKESTLAKLNKQSLKNLFALPATGSKLKNQRPWGITLQNLYHEMAHPLSDHFYEERLSSSMPRDAHVNKRVRFSTFRRSLTPRSSMPSMSAEQNMILDGTENYNKDHDRELMPPPGQPMLSRPSDEQRSPRTPGKSHNEGRRAPSLPVSPQQQSPHTPTRTNIEPDTSAIVSPKQAWPIPTILEPHTADEPSAHGELPNDSDMRVVDNTAAGMSPRSTASDRERSLLMDQHQFYKFLKDLWVTKFYEVDLDDVINPRSSSVTAFFKYFKYLQEFESQRKLTMIQSITYGPVRIVKEMEEQQH